VTRLESLEPVEAGRGRFRLRMDVQSTEVLSPALLSKMLSSVERECYSADRSEARFAPPFQSP